MTELATASDNVAKSSKAALTKGRWRLASRLTFLTQRLDWFRWPLTARILSINLLVLVIPLYGIVRADIYRSTLVAAELDSMLAEGQIVAKALGASAENVPAEFQNFRGDNFASDLGRLRQNTVAQLGSESRATMRILTTDLDSRMRLFDLNGDLMLDTRYLGSSVTPVRVEPLDEGSSSGWNMSLSGLWGDWFGADPLQPYSEPIIDQADHYSVMLASYNGELDQDVQIDEQGELIFLAAVPVQQYRRVIGSLLISRRDNTGVEAAVQKLQDEVFRVTLLTLGVTVVLSLLLANTIARPVRRLAVTANRVARSKRRSVQIPDLRQRRDEIGDLSFATRQMTEALWDQLDATDAFAADVSHELKNPLTSLKSAVETLQSYPDSPRRGELLEILNHDVGRMDRLITDISGSSRVDAEISRLEWDILDLPQLVDALASARSLSKPESDAKVHLKVLPLDADMDRPLLVRAVEDRIIQVMNNLIDNAITFSPDDGDIAIRLSAHANWVRLEIIDQGPGVPEHQLERVFERFYTDRPESEGFGNHSGLGLSIVRQIIGSHNGRVWAENADDDDRELGFSGAKFVVELPAASTTISKRQGR